MNPELSMTLQEAVDEVLGSLTGLDLDYRAEEDRFRAVTRQVNRATRAVALDNEWKYYYSVIDMGEVVEGDISVMFPASARIRIVEDDAVRLVGEDGRPRIWAYILPVSALHKYAWKSGLWCAVERRSIRFSRAINSAEEGLVVQAPAMREPKMLILPETGEPVKQSVLKQEIDFPYPDLVIAKAMVFYAGTDPVLQPRVPELTEAYKNLMYQIIERDTQHTDSAYVNNYDLGLHNGLVNATVPQRGPRSNFD